jgi:hypothetical protein
MEQQCLVNYLYKHEIRDMEWYYNPPAEYLGEDYRGILIVGARPAIPRNQTKDLNELLRKRILDFLASPTTENGRAMNCVVGKMIPNFMMTKTGVFQYREWGIEDGDLVKIAFLNLYKCRVREGTERDVVSHPFRLAPCVERYFSRQIEILKPKLLIFIWDFLWEGLGKLKDFGVDCITGIEPIIECGPRSDDPLEFQKTRNKEIKKRVLEIIGAV